MGMAELERRKDEKIDGVIYNMSPAPGYKHGIVNGNLYTIIKQGLKDSVCIVSIENLDFKYHPDENDHYNQTGCLLSMLMCTHPCSTHQTPPHTRLSALQPLLRRR